ncbi:MAG TPA: 30S ribosomal protein S20 [Phycisphaerae bacterium]|nr:30S ribosomal protein S20 [Phycisphaerae bacterium]
MAHSLSAKKRIRQNAKRRARNRGQKGQVRAVVRSYSSAVQGGDKAKSAEALRATIKKLDQAAAKGTIHKNTAGRKKSCLQRKLNALLKSGS